SCARSRTHRSSEKSHNASRATAQSSLRRRLRPLAQDREVRVVRKEAPPRRVRRAHCRDREPPNQFEATEGLVRDVQLVLHGGIDDERWIGLRKKIAFSFS